MNNYLEILQLANEKFVNVKDNKASFLKAPGGLYLQI